MKVYRLAKKKYSNDLSGAGAEINGGRWNNIGTKVVYTSSSRALACLEVAVHVKLNRSPKNYCIITLDIPMGIIKNLDTAILEGKEWNVYPPIELTQTIGDTFVRDNDHAVLRVPSAVVEGEYNYLLNPFHAEFKTIAIQKIQTFQWDKRLFDS